MGKDPDHQGSQASHQERSRVENDMIYERVNGEARRDASHPPLAKLWMSKSPVSGLSGVRVNKSRLGM
jgi:hypothetical protein